MIAISRRTPSGEELSTRATWYVSGRNPATGPPAVQEGRTSKSPEAYEVPFGNETLVFATAPPKWFLPMIVQISELGELAANWDSYGAPAIRSECAVTAIGILDSVLSPESPSPAVVPTNTGGIQLEWHLTDADIELEIESATQVELFVEDRRTGETREETIGSDLAPLAELLQNRPN